MEEDSAFDADEFVAETRDAVADSSATSTPDARHPPFYIVGIGASAGGLNAVLELFRALPVPTGMAFVLVTHLEPTHRSELAEIVGSATKLMVLHAVDECYVEPEHIYILPPNAQIAIAGGKLCLTARPPNFYYPIDHFLYSLAEDQASHSIAVVLSGGGSDGALGLRAIKTNYGTTLCQDPKTAEHPSMPQNAIASEAVDMVLSPAEIASVLHGFSTTPPAKPELADGVLREGSENSAHFSRILAILMANHGVDFSLYKSTTLARRIGRRLVVNQASSLKEYVELLEEDAKESLELYRDILICVTSFFRDPQTFETLQSLLRESLRTRARNDAFRIWVAGCATGEEAYSFAIAVREAMEAVGRQFPLQVFATDVSDTSIERARAGIFPEKIQDDVSPERLRRYFHRVDAGFQIGAHIRQSCIFARHDLTADPPFSQMDVVSCRNVMIYFGTVGQSRVIPALHYGLKPDGYLILGTAETIGTRTDLFSPVNHESKIYAKKAVPLRLSLGLNAGLVTRNTADLHTLQPPPISTYVDLEARAARILRDLYAPAGVVVNDDMQVLHFHGQTSFYLEPASGDASLNLLRLACQSLIYPLRGLLDRAIQEKAPVHQAGIRVERKGETREISLRIIPVSEKVPSWLILFEEEESRPDSKLPHPPAIDSAASEANGLELAHAQRELAQMRDYLRKIVEQHEASNEELRAANEEARSSNEELQSTNEELRTAKEELQSTNEELSTVNEELKQRNNDLRIATNDLTNVLSAAAIPIVMVDMDRRLRRFTPAAEQLLGLAAADIGLKFFEIRYAFPLPDLPALIDQAIEKLESTKVRGRDRLGRWYNVFARPYRTVDDRIEGAIVAFLDDDEQTRALESAESSRQFAEAIVETVQHPLLVLDCDLRIQRATNAFYQMFNVRKHETERQRIGEIGGGQWNLPELQRLLELALLRDVPFTDLDIEHEFPGLGRRTMRLNARRISSPSSEHQLLLAIEDVTERRETAEIQYRRLFESARDAVIIVEAWTGKVSDVNPYFTELTRYQRTEVVGKHLADLRIFAKTGEVRDLVPAALASISIRHDSVRVHAKDGTQLILEIIANAYRVRDRQYIQLNVRDVTERRRMEEQLRSSNADLQQFAFAASHDLQEPLRTVTNFTQLIERNLGGSADPETRSYLSYVIGAAARMRQMVLDLLAYSQVLRANVTPAAVNVEAVLAAVLLNLQMAISSSGAHITFDPLPSVVIDETHLTQLLQNLISNALKYHGPEPPRVHIAAANAGREAIFTVSDNGVGIDPLYADEIFAIFKRLHGADYPGSGIGLAICKRIVDSYGGRIWVDSVPGSGAKFSFALPSAPSPSRRS